MSDNPPSNSNSTPSNQSIDSIESDADRNVRKQQEPVYKFVFTGGPCGGKTTALARVFSFLKERNFEVITCPEAYTLLNSHGMGADFFSTPGMPKYIQGAVLDLQLQYEQSVQTVLMARGKPAVVLCDRGTMDGSVYMSDEEFGLLLNERNLNTVQVRDHRYDACFHMVTAADGAEEHYTLDNNRVRTESKAHAIEVDQKTQKAWCGHPHLYIIDNSTDFEGKMNRLIDIISKIVGLPSNLQRRSAKFLLSQPPDVSKFPVDYQVFRVEKVYLSQTQKTSDDYSFVRRRDSIQRATHQILGSVFQLTVVSNQNERKRIISPREYGNYTLMRDSQRHVVIQERISFLYHQQSFCIHQYLAPVSGLCILHAQVEAERKQSVDLPPFLEIERKLEHNNKQDEEQYGAYSLSLIR